MARRALDGNPQISTRFGQPGIGSLGKHLGYDYVRPTGTPVKAPVSGKIRGLYSGGAGGNYIEMDGGQYWHRFLHLQKFNVKTGQSVSEGQVIGFSNNTGQTTGPHLHHDVRKAGTTWNASFSNYIDWEAKLASAPAPVGNMPPVGSKVQLIPVDTRNTFRAGTTNVAGSIHVKDNSYIYTVRGYDSKYPGRVLINSASAGGDGVALALYYTNGNKIPGWKQV